MEAATEAVEDQLGAGERGGSFDSSLIHLINANTESISGDYTNTIQHKEADENTHKTSFYPPRERMDTKKQW